MQSPRTAGLARMAGEPPRWRMVWDRRAVSSGWPWRDDRTAAGRFWRYGMGRQGGNSDRGDRRKRATLSRGRPSLAEAPSLGSPMSCEEEVRRAVRRGCAPLASRARPGTFANGRLGIGGTRHRSHAAAARRSRRADCLDLPAALPGEDALHGRQRDPTRLGGAAERGASRPQQDDAGPHGGRYPRPAEAPALGHGPCQPGPARTRSQLSSRPEEGSQAGSQGIRTPNLARVTRNVRGRAAGGRGMRALALAAQAPGQSGSPHCARCLMVSTSQIGPDGRLSDTAPIINPLPVHRFQHRSAAVHGGFQPVPAERFSGTPHVTFRCDLERSGSHSHLFWTRGTAPSGSPAPLNSNAVQLPEGRAKAGRLQDRAAASAMMPSARPAPPLTGPRDRTVASRLPRHRSSAGVRGVLTGAEAARHRASGTEPAVPANPDPASGGTVARRRGSPGAPWTSQARRTGTPRRTRRRRGTRPRRAARLGLGHHARPAMRGAGPERARAAAFGPAPRRSRPWADHPT